MKKIKEILVGSGMLIIFAFPSSTNYKLDAFELGSGGEIGSTSPNYSMEGILGGLKKGTTSSNYQLGAGLMFVQEADTPPAPTFSNDSNWYNKLKIIINTGPNPSDAVYAIAITDDNWTTTKWVQNDNTVGDTLGIEDFQSYTDWGGATGEQIIGLDPATTYKVKVKARHGKYTESGLGPEAEASTSNVSITFDLDVSSIDEETSGPYTVNFGELNLGSVDTAGDLVWVDFDTNAEMGGNIFVYDLNAGLKSSTLNYTISSTTGDLNSASEGFGLQGNSVSESSGGPLSIVSPYNGLNDNVGIVSSDIREIFNTSSNPITAGRGSFYLKAKASETTPFAADYTDTITVIAAATF